MRLKASRVANCVTLTMNNGYAAVIRWVDRLMLSVMQLDETFEPHPGVFWPALRWNQSGIQTPEAEYQQLYPVNHLNIIESYSRVLSRHGGYAEFEAKDGMGFILPFLPDMLELTAQLACLLDEISETGRSIYTLRYIRERDDDDAPTDEIENLLGSVRINTIAASTPLPLEIQRVFHRMPNLSVLELRGPDDRMPTFDRDSDCGSVSNRGTSGPLHKNLNDSCVRKVGVVKLFSDFSRTEDKLFNSLAHQFRDRGWSERHETDLEVNFVFRSQ
ncbi:hypothetical protein HDU81_009583 [Chytriomyces hyalinus]|nr:hypothetical protein HDU81_009583 [Chytriomyces hyalinus]